MKIPADGAKMDLRLELLPLKMLPLVLWEGRRHCHGYQNALGSASTPMVSASSEEESIQPLPFHEQ